MNTLKLKTKNLIRLLILVFLIGTLSACGGFQNQNQQAAGRVNASTAPVVKKTQALSATPTIDRSPATLIEEDIQEAGIEYPQIDSANIMALDVIAGTVHNNPSRVVWALDGQSFGVVNNSQVVRYNARDLAIEAVYAVQEPAYLLDYSPDGHTIAITEDQTSIQFWDINIGSRLSEVPPVPYSFHQCEYIRAHSRIGTMYNILSFSGTVEPPITAPIRHAYLRRQSYSFPVAGYSLHNLRKL